MTERPKSARHISKGLPTLPQTPKEENKDSKTEVKKTKSSHSSSRVKDKMKKDKSQSSVVELTPENQTIIDEFADYAWNNQLEELKNLMPKVLELKIINGLNVRGQPALYCAARNGHTKILIELLNAGNHIDVNVKAQPHGGTPLHAAGVNGKAEAVALLLACGASKDIKNASGQSASEGVGQNILDIYAAFSEGLMIKTCETLVFDFPILKELTYVQAVLKKVELMKQKALQKQQEQERALQEAAAKEEAEGIANQPGFQLGIKKNVEKVAIDYSKLSSPQQDEYISNLALSKTSYAFANDLSDTNFLSYFNNPALVAQQMNKHGDNYSGTQQSGNGNVDKSLLSKIDNLQFTGTPEIPKTNSSQFSQSGVIESLGFNPLFFNGSAFVVEEEGKRNQGGVLSLQKTS